MRISNEQLTKNSKFYDRDSANITSASSHKTGTYPSTVRQKNTLLNGHINSSNSAPNLQELRSRRCGVVENQLLDTHSPEINVILSKRKYLERRQRSFSEDDVKEVNTVYGMYRQQSSKRDLVASTDVLWKTGMKVCC